MIKLPVEEVNEARRVTSDRRRMVK